MIACGLKPTLVTLAYEQPHPWGESAATHRLLLHVQGCQQELGAGYFLQLDYKVPWLLSLENRRKIEPKEKIPSCLIPRLLVIFKWRLEILVTTLPIHVPTDNEEKD